MLDFLDPWMERALLHQLSHTQQRALKFLLGVTSLAGLLVSLAYPRVAGWVLLFPCIVNSFFFGSRYTPAGLAWILAFWWLRGDPLETATFAFSAAVGILFASVTARRYRVARLRQLDLEQAMRLARQLQAVLEPPSQQILDGRLEVASWSHVSKLLGGDFFSIRRVDSQRVQFLLADVMGKGLAAGLLGSYLHGVSQQLGLSGPAETLTRLNQTLCDLAFQETVFVTAVCVEADFAQGCWRVARAGHEEPLLVGRPLQTESHLPLGLKPDQSYQESTLAIQAGDQLLLCTDGVTDALGSLGEQDLRGLSPCAGVDRLAARCQGCLKDDATLAWIHVL